MIYPHQTHIALHAVDQAHKIVWLSSPSNTLPDAEYHETSSIYEVLSITWSSTLAIRSSETDWTLCRILSCRNSYHSTYLLIQTTL